MMAARLRATSLKVTGAIALLALTSCTDQPASNASRNDALIEEAQALEKRANDQVNETIATIEAENKDAMDKMIPSEEPAGSNAVENGNQI